MCSGSLQNAQKPVQVVRKVRPRIRERVPDPGLCGQVAHRVEPLLGEEAQNALLVDHVESQESQAGILRIHRTCALTPRLSGDHPQFPQAVELQLHVVVLVETVDAEHLVPLIDQPAGQMIANEPGHTGNEDLHRGYVPAPAPARGGTAACEPAALSWLGVATSGPLAHHRSPSPPRAPSTPEIDPTPR